MANPPKRSFRDGPYEIVSLNQVFAISGILLLISVGLMVEDDYTREWKLLQDNFNDIEISRTERALSEADAAIGKDAMDAAEAAISEAESTLQDKVSDREALTAKLQRASAVLKDLTLRFGILKSKIDSRDYFISVAEHEAAPELEVLTSKRATMAKELDQMEGELELAMLAVAAVKKEIAEFEGAVIDSKKALKDLTFERDLIERSLGQIDLNFVTKSILNAPLMDFVAPTQKVRQIVLPDLKDDLYFAKVFKVDRCQTCHMAIDRAGFEHDTLRVDDQVWTGDILERTAEHVKIQEVGADSPVVVKIPADSSVSVEIIDAVFRSHPNLALYLGATSAHPINQFGCTVCHDGMGHAVDFIKTAHTPDLALPSSDHATEASAESHGGGHGEGSGWFERPGRQTWKDEHHWHQRHHWAYPMLPKTMIEARCLNCHEPDVPLPGADTLNAAREVLEKAACYGCHKIRGYEGAPKPAPPLTHIGDKLDRDWMHHWLKRPRDFRERTYMPRFFDLSNVDEVEGGHDFPAMQDVEVEAISAYLFKVSKSRWSDGDDSYTKVEPGDTDNGENLFGTLGCVACHTSAAEEKPAEHQDFGPDLSRIADKLTRVEGRGAAWLYNWISDPKRHFVDTTMPNLRLTEQEARDITAWLLQRKQSDPAPRPQLKPDMIDSMVVGYLEEKHTRAKARAKAEELKTEGVETQLAYLGERTINRLGCFGCHDIAGFEGRLGIGAELSTIGSKILSKFDFGHVEIQKTKHDWIAQKIDEPRIFDVTKVKAPGDKLKMPDFELEPEEVGLLTTFLIGMVDDKIPETYKFRPGERTRARIAGDDLIQERNCVACHEFTMDEFELELVDEEGATSTHQFSGIQLIDTRPLALGEVDEDGDQERFETTIAFQLWSDIPGLGLEAGNALSIDIDDEGGVEIVGEAVTSYQLTRVKAGIGGVMASRVMRNWVLDSSDDELDLWNVVGSAHANDLDADDVVGQAGAIKTSRSFVPPPLVGEGAKVQPTWLGDFLRAPFVLRPQVQVRMPTFHLNEAEVNTLVDYFQALAEEKQIATALKDLLTLQADVKGGAFKGRYANLEAHITELLDAHDAHHFFNVTFTESAIAWTVNPALRRHGPRDEHLDTYYLEKEQQQPAWLSLGRELFEDPNINCASCHVRNGRSPGGEPKDWAPDLARARFRLQPSWIRQWITNPGRLVPDTNMPRLFPLDKQQYQDILKAHSSEQIEAVKDFLMSGLSAGVEVSPRKARAGAQVTITSNSLDLDGIKSVTVGDRLVNEGSSQFVRIKGRGGRTTALQVRIPSAVSGGTVWLEATDGRFTARTRIEVTKTN